MTTSGLVMTGAYDYRLVALSVLIAILASYAALDLAGRVTSARGKVRALWLTGGATAMGIGIWSMHYIGMLAFHLPVPIKYDWPTVLLSLLAAILASAIALFVVSRRKMGLFRAIVGSIFMGAGIAAMHYVGMDAMRLPAMCIFSRAIVILSAVLAIVISFVALLLTFYFRGQKSAWSWQKTVSALVMGAAVPTMHYTGMAAASFVPTREVHGGMARAINISTLGAASIIVVTFMVLGLVTLTSLIDRRFSFQASELEASEKRYRQIIESAMDAFIGMDSTGAITDWNAQAERIFGWTKPQVVGRVFSAVVLPEQARPAFARRMRDFVAIGEGPAVNERLEMSALYKNGREFPIELTVSVIRRGDSHTYSAFLRDITGRKLNEEERERAKEAAEAGSRAKSEFLANMSHEIRTPLNGVMGMTDLVLETQLTSEQREYLETVKMSADSLLTVINDILDFSKIEAGKIDLEVLDFNLRDSLEGTLKTLALKADEIGLELLCEIAPDVPETVCGDSNRLRQLVVNLVANAIKFTEEGEVGLKVHMEPGEGRERLFHFTVSDTGVGIPPEKLDLIFQPFSQADASTTRKYGGTGLGLAISTSLVEMMGGKISVESEVGKGTRFHFTVRMGVPDPKTVDLASVATPEILKGVKVLVVDDNRTNRRILEAMLKLWEMQPTIVESGDEALAELEGAGESGEQFALMLTDMHMPKMDGFSLIEHIRQRHNLSTTAIMMLTSAGHKGDSARCTNLGVAAYLLKPIRQSELREAIARALGAREQKNDVPLITRFSLSDAREPSGCLRVLLAEDNAVNRFLATRLLEKRGHRITTVENGRDALAAMEKEIYDLVLMDIQMPEMDGLEATAALREREIRKGDGVHQQVIAMTAHAMKGDRERCLAAGMDGYLSKPIRQQELDAMIGSLLARRQTT